MTYKEMRKNIEEMADNNYQDFVKALISYEKGINDEKALDSLYEEFMDNDTQGLLSEEFDYSIDNLKEQGLLEEESTIKEERDDLINVVGNLIKDPELLEIKDNQGEKLKVANFTLVSNDKEGGKNYHSCSAYGEKAKGMENLKQGDYMKVFGQTKVSLGDDGKEYTNIRVLSSKLLKAKERDQDKSPKKESILGAIKKYKVEDKAKQTDKSDKKIETER
ncbi:single-stranded DNA-binding protein [Facklamia sp. P12932]|uniref:single-stranded DNA-binding protein n=1 Tax=Facklamia sp. P12932 TaxID=3421947 RepID=UPI003D175993